MSPKDLWTISFLDKILDSGASVLKIEGRARSPEYVRTVTECYREAIQSCLEGTFSPDRIKRWETRLSGVFNRGFWEGHYLGQKMGEWSRGYGSDATRRKIYLGRGINYLKRLGVAEFLREAEYLEKGDEILVTGPTTGVIEWKVPEIQVDHRPVDRVGKGEHFALAVPGKIRRSDKLYKLVKSVTRE